MDDTQSGRQRVSTGRLRSGGKIPSTVKRRDVITTLVSTGLTGLAGCLSNNDPGDEMDDQEEDESAGQEEDEDEPVLDIVTTEATAVEATTATLTGELLTVEGVEVAEITFEYGPSDGEMESSVAVGMRESVGVFEHEVSELEANTEYEFRAVARAADLVVEGGVESFATKKREPDYTVTVDGIEFDPETLAIDVGETVEWVFEGSGHNIFVTEAPTESDWDGTEGYDRYSEGHVHQHTFQVPGTYEYYCQPHRNVGMEGTVTVES